MTLRDAIIALVYESTYTLTFLPVDIMGTSFHKNLRKLRRTFIAVSNPGLLPEVSEGAPSNTCCHPQYLSQDLRSLLTRIFPPHNRSLKSRQRR